jgi:hypothetical protein
MADKDTPPVGGSVNPYDFMALVAALTASQKQPTQSGLNRLFSPEIGFLSGTYYGQTGQGQDDSAMMLDLGPDILRASNLPEGDIRRRIVTQIVANNVPAWDVKRSIREEVAAMALSDPTLDADTTVNELLGFVDKIQSQNDNILASKAKAQVTGAKDMFSQAGMRSPDLRFSPEELAPEIFARFASDEEKRQARLNELRPPSGKTLESAKKFAETTQKQITKAQGPMSGTEEVRALARGAFGGDMARRDVPDVEQRRFADVAKNIVARSQKLSAPDVNKERATLVKKGETDALVRALVAEGIAKQAEAAGYVPAMVDLMKRAQFIYAAGG